MIAAPVFGLGCTLLVGARYMQKNGSDLKLSPETAVVDVTCVVGMSVLFVACETLQLPKRWTFLAIGLFLAVFLTQALRRGKNSWRDFGFRSDNLRASAWEVGLFTLLAGGTIVAWSLIRDRASWSREVVILAVCYPPWAIIQQFAFQGLLHRGLMTLVRSRVLQVLLSAASFAAVHAGNAPLVMITFVAGLAWSLLYRRNPNLWMIAASHTVLAALAYPILLGNAPLSSV